MAQRIIDAIDEENTTIREFSISRVAQNGETLSFSHVMFSSQYVADSD